MKNCCRCKKEKDLSDFNKDRQCRDGLRPFCRECSKKEWLLRYAKMKEKESGRKSAFYKENRENILKKTSNWLKNHRAYGAKKVALRRAVKKMSAPPWLTIIHLQQIQWYYDAAKMFKRDTGVTNHVDHIHPIKGNGFCGLHVPWNLRVIKASENSSKGNKPPANEANLFWL
jgi:5-methylcytosine-specific restriction endonuclease McrA